LVRGEIQSSIDHGRENPLETVLSRISITKPSLKFPDLKKWLLAKYGKILNAGTKDYHYQIVDQAGNGSWERIYPNMGML